MKSQTTSPGPDLILRNIHDGLLLLDPDGIVRYTNQAFCEMIGRSESDLVGKPVGEVFDEKVLRQIPIPNLESINAGGQIHFNIEIPNENGNKGAYCFFASPVRDVNGKTIGLLQNFRGMDGLRTMILQLEEVNQAIQNEKDKAERIVDSIADGIFTVDQDLVIRSFSSKMEQLTGIAPGKAIGSRCPEVLRGTKCETDCPLRWSFAHSATVEGCREVFRVNHRRQIPVSITTAFLQDQNGVANALVGVVHDQTELERLRSELHEKYSFQNMIGRSNVMQRIFQVIQTVAETDATVLIQGETGTGKEIVAQAIHHRSLRRDAPFVMLNCAALNDNLLESELFGHVRGAFTGAVADKPGRFELATGGTLFLDEIGDTTPALQSKLLRALEEKTIERVGDTRTRRVDVRIIAATHRDLKKMVQEGRFREDLYYRLMVVPVNLPLLRERHEDIPLLVQHFMEKYRPRYFAKREEEFEGISNRALALMLEYDWPGNVRELEHAVEHAMISTTTNRIERAFLPAPLKQLQPPDLPVNDNGEPAAVPADMSLRETLEAHHWNATRAAKALGISRTTLWRRLKKLDLLK